MDLPIRPRRNRRTSAIRGLVRESRVSAQQLIYPVFVHEDKKDHDLESLPGVKRYSIDGLLREAERAHGLGIGAIVLFPNVPDARKSRDAAHAADAKGLVPRAIKALKQKLPGLCVITDVALDPYNSDGHDGIVREGRVLNDETVEMLGAQAVMHAQAGADIVAPSDMMDGRRTRFRATRRRQEDLPDGPRQHPRGRARGRARRSRGRGHPSGQARRLLP
jgi:porphobilinogen synthase